MKPMCDTCRAFYVLDSQCRRHAPAVLPLPQANAAGVVIGYKSIGIYPATTKESGCAEHIVDDSPVLQ